MLAYVTCLFKYLKRSIEGLPNPDVTIYNLPLPQAMTLLIQHQCYNII